MGQILRCAQDDTRRDAVILSAAKDLYIRHWKRLAGGATPPLRNPSYSLFPIPYSLFPIAYSLLPIPYCLFPIP